MAFRKPEWLDTAVGIGGFVLSVYSVLALMPGASVVTGQIAILGAIALGMLVVLVAVVFRPRHSFHAVSRSKANQTFKKELQRAGEVVLLNPDASESELALVLEHTTAQKIPLSIVGDAAVLYAALETLVDGAHESWFRSVRVSGLSSNEFIACLADEKETRVTVVSITPKTGFVFRLRDKALVGAIMAIMKREAPELGGFISMEHVADPAQMIRVAREQQRKYLRVFNSLQEGRVSFFGTEVQIVQAGWVESGQFQRIDTLDMTMRPDRLLARHRYNAANKDFIAAGGRIRRCYMVRDRDLKDATFRSDLAQLCAQQRDIGVEIGLLVIDMLPEHLRKDFILYDDSVVLIEDQQASSDYALGRSTAYFGQTDINAYREEFDDVWTGRATGTPPADQVDALLGLHE